MSLAGPPTRGNDPLHVLLMAAALVLAAMLGAAIGFAIDFLGGDSAGQEQR